MIQTYDPGFSDLYHLLSLLISEHQARHWQTTAAWFHPLGDIHRKNINAVRQASQLA